MKYITVVLCIFLCFGKSNKLELVNATLQKWTSGKQGIEGVKYRFTLKTNLSSNDLTIDQIWVGDINLDCKVFKFGGNIQDKTFTKGDTIIVTAEYIVTANNRKTNKVPYNYEGAALIAYLKGEKRKYFEVEELEPIKSLKYH